MHNKNWKKRLSSILVIALVMNLLLPALPAVVSAETTKPSDLIISEYIEGSSFNKAIEIYNGTGQAIDLSNYTLELYANGATSTTAKLTLESSLDDGATYVIYHNQANDEIKSKGNLANSSVINFNGDDALVLRKSNQVIDSIGQVGTRVENLKDVTLVRKSNITTGDTIIDDAFDPAVEWITFPINDASNLGTHKMDGVTPEDPEPEEIITIADARHRQLAK